MSDEEILRDQINKIAIQIEKIEQTAKQKEEYIKSKLNEEYDSKINEIEVNLLNQKAILKDIVEKINELDSKKDELTDIVKNLENEYKTLIKNKEKILNEHLKAIIKERKSKTKEINKQIKNLEKELKTKEKS
jgi:hypothetical protein